jgi:hypothetical protein
MTVDGSKAVAKITERIESLEECLKALKTKQQRIEARPGTLEARPSRREDTRRKILAGAIVSQRSNKGCCPIRCCGAGSLRRWRARTIGRSLGTKSVAEPRLSSER